MYLNNIMFKVYLSYEFCVMESPTVNTSHFYYNTQLKFKQNHEEKGTFVDTVTTKFVDWNLK